MFRLENSTITSKVIRYCEPFQLVLFLSGLPMWFFLNYFFRQIVDIKFHSFQYMELVVGIFIYILHTFYGFYSIFLSQRFPQYTMSSSLYALVTTIIHIGMFTSNCILGTKINTEVTTKSKLRNFGATFPTFVGIL